jgi:EmrB/QacA subfamily drug resistance transporter
LLNKLNIGTWVLFAAILGSSMSSVDSTVVYVALPVLQAELGATVVQAQWIVEAYVLLQAALILVGGSLGDRYGRRRVFAIGLILFAIASAFCGLAATASQLIAARALQALGGALLAPSSLAIISAHFDDKSRGRAIGAWSGSIALAAAIGPLLGGWIIGAFSWRWAFYINVPIGILTLAILFWRVPESRNEEIEGKLDWVGASLATLGLGGVTFGLIESSNYGLSSPIVLTTMAIGLTSLIAFVWSQKHAANPLMPLSLFRSSNFSGANLITLLLYGAFAVTLFFMPFNLIQIQGYSPLEAGASLFPISVILGAFSGWAGGLVSKYGAKLPLIVGPLIVTAAFLFITQIGIGGSYWLTIFPAVVIMAVGLTIVFAPLSTTVMSSAPMRLSGTASGINNALISTANVLFVSLLGIVALRSFGSAVDRRIESLDLPPLAVEQIAAETVRLADATAPDSLNSSEKAAVNNIFDLAFVDAFKVLMVFCAGLSVASAGVAWRMIDGKPREKEAG